MRTNEKAPAARRRRALRMTGRATGPLQGNRSALVPRTRPRRAHAPDYSVAMATINELARSRWMDS